MSVTAAPGATFEAVASNFPTGLTGTIGVRLIDNAGATTTTRTTTSIAEYPTGSGVYAKTMTAPSVAGQYTILWDDGATTPGHVATEDLVVTYSATSSSTSSVYVTSTTLKATLQITGSVSDADADAACAAASRAIDEACQRRFWLDSVDQTRVYTADTPAGSFPPYYTRTMSNMNHLDIDDLVTLTSVTVDADGDGVYETTWVRGTDFYLDPPNAASDSYPYERIVLIPHAGRVFPGWDNAVKVTGKFGWPTVPPQVVEYAGILAAQLYLRSRQAPFGVIMAGVEIGSSARISRFDPDFDRLLGNLVKPTRLIA